jgi:hypothetical protein
LQQTNRSDPAQSKKQKKQVNPIQKNRKNKSTPSGKSHTGTECRT